MDPHDWALLQQNVCETVLHAVDTAVDRLREDRKAGPTRDELALRFAEAAIGGEHAVLGRVTAIEFDLLASDSYQAADIFLAEMAKQKGRKA